MQQSVFMNEAGPESSVTSFRAGIELIGSEAGLTYDHFIFSSRRRGCLTRSPRFRLAKGVYLIKVQGENFGLSGLDDSFLEISDSTGLGRYKQSLLAGISHDQATLASFVYVNSEDEEGLEVGIFVPEGVNIRLDSIEIQQTKYMHDFSILNKSYRKDLRWTVTLYRSWCRFTETKHPFYIVVPESDLSIFIDAFAAEIDNSQISRFPNILSEEWVLAAANIEPSPGMSGWHIQQLIKLCFSKLKIATNYLTMDSTMLFTKKFNYSSLLSDGSIYTAAAATSKTDFFDRLRNANEDGWLDGKIVNISESFNRICTVMENHTESTNAYISCTGMFNSDLSAELDAFAHSRGVNGFVGLIEIAPYEFAWYGEFVYSQRRSCFIPHDPHLMTLAQSAEQAEMIDRCEFNTHDHHFGVMLQLPAADLCNPESLYSAIAEGRLR
ncbi:hypothetical protein MSC49_21950 [Methylosinus sp. C49]|uniref:DUF6492 family protein n=1 Tax=Methylosinus sp. C49 TaxID=2699395 RepID=UPI001366DD22|nr:DUF6492 family protein [Methylosinus sp. C49]BBU62260.1 hypothetical protein MSC49_21950 [Methylosinus sp. C49]